MGKRYIAKPNTWFKEKTEVKLIDNCEPMGWLMEGIRVREDGAEYMDQELCHPDEFEAVEEE